MSVEEGCQTVGNGYVESVAHAVATSLPMLWILEVEARAIPVRDG